MKISIWGWLGAFAAVAAAALGIAIPALASNGSGGVGTGGGAPTTTPSEGVFPLRSAHTYGDGLGAGRGHQGQDLITKCGKPILAVQDGRVQMRDYQSAAGNYVVIDGAGKLLDTVYMHMQASAEVRKGERVFAGDEIGRVGDTGRASTCHLHFEMWSNPGYYEGGEPVDPEPSLRAWDRAGRR